MRTSHRWMVALAAVTALITQARQLTPAEALALAEDTPIATTLTRPNPADPAQQPMLVHTVTSADSPTPMIYVFNRAENKGFIITAADDCTGTVLLGYSDDGSFAIEDNPTLSWWLGQYAMEIDDARGSSVSDTRDNKRLAAPKMQRKDIAPIIHTSWNQDMPFNNLCPFPVSNTGGKVRCPTGCIATAISQVMNFHRWPEQGTGTHSYLCENVGRKLNFNFGATTFDWDNMLDDYRHAPGRGTAQQQTAVATLMYAVGVATDMNYGPRGSGSNYFTGARALLRYFNYDKGMQVLERKFFPLIEWENIIYSELQEGRPVLYGGRNSEDGHAFVIDGLQNSDYFHVNWGWGGMSNGYFLITALNPLVQGIGGSSAGFNIGQNMIIGVQPPVEGSEIVPSLKFQGGFTSQNSTYNRLRQGSVIFDDLEGIFNGAIEDITVTPGVKLVSATDTVIYIPAVRTMNLSYGQGFKRYVLAASNFPTSGTYTVYPTFRDTHGAWHDARVAIDAVQSLTLTATPTSLSFTPDAAATLQVTDMTLNTAILPGSDFSLTALLTAEGGEFYGKLMPALMADGEVIAKATPIVADIREGNPQTSEWIASFPATVDPGVYQLVIVTEDNHIVSPQPLEVAVGLEPYAMETPEAQVSIPAAVSGTGTEQDPYIVSATFDARITLEGVQDYFAETISAKVFYDASTPADTYIAGFAGVSSKDDTSTFQAEIPIDSLEANHTYRISAWGSSAGQLSEPAYFRVATASAALPTTDEVSIRVCGTTAAVTSPAHPLAAVTISDLKGAPAIAAKAEPQETTEIDIAALPGGIYILTAAFADGAAPVSRKIVR